MARSLPNVLALRLARAQIEQMLPSLPWSDDSAAALRLRIEEALETSYEVEYRLSKLSPTGCQVLHFPASAMRPADRQS